MRAVVIYYSHSNHTQIIAEKLSEKLGVDIVRIKTKSEYIIDDAIAFQPTTPPLDQIFLTPDTNLDKYSDFILGFPIWNGLLPPPVEVLLSSVDFTGRRVYPFSTFGGFLGQTNHQIHSLCDGAVICKPLRVKFIDDKCRTPDDELNAWIEYVKNDAKIF